MPVKPYTRERVAPSIVRRVPQGDHVAKTHLKSGVTRLWKYINAKTMQLRIDIHQNPLDEGRDVNLWPLFSYTIRR